MPAGTVKCIKFFDCSVDGNPQCNTVPQYSRNVHLPSHPAN